ncbi:MAG: hypothetical protein Q8O75_00515 [bacterium]|nr:hypothetical protein [bacterium]
MILIPAGALLVFVVIIFLVLVFGPFKDGRTDSESKKIDEQQKKIAWFQI